MRAFVFLFACACHDAVPDATGQCKTDDDCTAPCGPCGSGEKITSADRTKECVVNPCPNAVGVCGPDHTCRVK